MAWRRLETFAPPAAAPWQPAPQIELEQIGAQLRDQAAEADAVVAEFTATMRPKLKALKELKDRILASGFRSDRLLSTPTFFVCS